MRPLTRSEGILGRSRFGIVTSCAYAVEELATRAEVEAKVQIMSSLHGNEHHILVSCGDSYLEVVMERDDVGVTNGYSLQHGDLITDLRSH